MKYVGLAMLSLSVPVFSAEMEPAIVPLPSIMDFTRGGGWGVALGVGVEYETAYDGSDEYEFELDPAGAIQWRSGNHMLFWEGMELGYRGRLNDVWLLQIGGRNEGGLEPDDSDEGHLDGFKERDSHIVGFLEVRRAIGDEWRNWLGARLMGGESGFGWLGVLAAGHRFGDRLDGVGTEIFLFSTFGTDEFITKDFGVTADDAASGFPETELSGGYRSTGFTLVDRRYITEHITVISQAGAELYNGEIQDSPVSREDFEIEIGLSLAYHF
jgi:outer membrane scaffolding protein for murein synthesis (MipA/OmpV family)